MDILLNQEFRTENLVCQSGKFSTDEFQKVIQDIVMKYRDYTDSSNECFITTTKTAEFIEGRQIIDVEVLLPISYRIPIEKPYSYKDEIKITNALYAKIEQVEKLHEALNEINEYIVSKGLQPVTSAYLVQTKQMDKAITEIYIGINPNIL
jgi:SPX domain protein involved in polyphosphate accumulation